ncbi:hypothetical protein E1A91_A12G144700v1 [Gossypium mustelinum]|uniref:RRM domain-containing protein n=1 Tax=Gossypium mustelinum TaxID=34275 RepID=A0A5D2WVT2_GOSMU|nr:hypothetical protein E1A91_A12G144700v1 [Gossypium mustelinum]
METSSKKSIAKFGKKGKREAKETPEKQVAAKKQKKNDRVAHAIVKKKAEEKMRKKTKKKKETSSSSDDSSDSKDKEKLASNSVSSESGSEEDSPSDENKMPVVAKKGSVPAAKTKKVDSSSNFSSHDGFVEEEEPQKAALPNSVAKSVPSVTASSDSNSEEDSDEEKNEDSSSSSFDDSDSEEEMDFEAKKPVNGKTSKKEYSSGRSSKTNFYKDEAPSNKVLVALKKPFPTTSNDSEDDSSDESDDEQPAAKKLHSKVAPDSGKAAKVKKVNSSEEKESEESSDDNEEIRSIGSKTLFVGNISFQIEQDEMYNFFKDIGELMDIRLATDAEGNLKGYGHVVFATAEAAQKPLELNGEYLMNRAVRLDLARERGAYTPHSRKVEEVTFEQYVRFDQSLGQDEIKNSLKEHIGSCGEISRVAIPVDWATGGVKGYAYLDFNDGDSFNEALELDGSELNKFSLTVNETKPKGESRDGPDSGRGGGGRGGGRGRGTPNKPNLGAAGTGKKTTFNDED